MNMVFNPTTIMSDFEGSLAETVRSEVCVILLYFLRTSLFIASFSFHTVIILDVIFILLKRFIGKYNT